MLPCMSLHSTEVHVISWLIPCHSIKWPWWCPCTLSNVQTVLLVRSSHTKLLVLCSPAHLVSLFAVHSLLSCQAVYVPQTVPEFRVKVTKSFITFPSTSEVNCPIRDSTLDHYPPSLVCLHVTSNLHFTKGSASQISPISFFPEFVRPGKMFCTCIK